MQISANKIFLRDKYRLIREVAKSEEKDSKIYTLFKESDAYNIADTIFVYYSVRTEVDTLKIISTALGEEKRVALPKCTDRDGNMEFYYIKNLKDSLTDGIFSLTEPDVSGCKRASHGENSLCIVPGVAFDKKGFRLGYGGGYYDRYLSNFKGRTVGLCYEECLCDELPRDTYDIKVDMIITDNKIYELK